MVKFLLQLLLPCLLLMLSMPASAHVERTQTVELKDRMCHARAGGMLTADQVRGLPYSCGGQPTGFHDRWLWLRADARDVAHAPSGGRLLIDQTRFEAMRTVVVYADGKMIEHSFRSGRADGHWAAGGFLQVDVPVRDAPIAEIYVGIERLVNFSTMRKIRAVSEAEFGRVQTMWVALASLFAGVVAASLAYTSFLYAGLRHAFLRQYAFWCLAVLAYGLSWSNLIFYIAPGLAGSWGVRLNLYTAGAAALFAALFLNRFLEPDALPSRLRRLLAGTGWASLAAAVLASFDQFGASYAYVADRVLNAVVAFGVALFLICIAVAARRGSRSVRFYALAWSPALAAFVLRMLRNFHLIPHADWIDMGLFGATIIETMLLSAAISDRFRKLETERNHAQAERAEFSRLAEADLLTGIYNRRGFVAHAEALIARDTLRVGLLLIDVDHFKSINDRFGHDAGDQVLAAIGDTLARLSDLGCIVGRLGGEEFGLIVSAPHNKLAALAETVRENLNALEFSFSGESLRITVSVGAAGPGLRPFIELYRSADQALYAAKSEGRDRLVWASAPVDRAA